MAWRKSRSLFLYVRALSRFWNPFNFNLIRAKIFSNNDVVKLILMIYLSFTSSRMVCVWKCLKKFYFHLNFYKSQPRAAAMATSIQMFMRMHEKKRKNKTWQQRGIKHLFQGAICFLGHQFKNEIIFRSCD